MTDKPTLRAKDAPDLGPFSWDDPFILDDQLTEDERMIRDSAQSYCLEKLQPRVLEAFQNEQTDPEIFAEMGAMGLLGSCYVLVAKKRVSRLTPIRPTWTMPKQRLPIRVVKPAVRGVARRE